MDTNKENRALYEVLTLEDFKALISMALDVLAARFVYYSSFFCLRLFPLGILRNFYHSVLSCKLINLMKSDSQTVVQNRLTV